MFQNNEDFPPLEVVAPRGRPPKVNMPKLKQKEAQTFRLVHGNDGSKTWAPMSAKSGFQGYVTKGDHIEFIGKNAEYSERDENEENDDAYGEYEDDQFADADDYSRPDVQKELYNYRAKKQKMDSSSTYDDTLFEFPDDGYDYTQHIKAPGSGIFIPIDIDYFKKVMRAKKGKNAIVDPEDLAILASHDVDDLQDAEIDAHLYGAGEDLDAVGELDDDFIIQAHGGVLVEDESLLEDPNLARERKALERKHIFGDADDFDEYEIEEEWEEEEGERNDTDLERAFENALNLYDDEDIGELDPEDPEVQGKSDFSNYEQLILEMHNEFIPPAHYKYTAPIRPDNDEPAPEVVYSSEEEEQELEVVEVETRIEEKWDCQSILSTYSNTDNHPKLIVEKSNVQIKLSNKTGMPLGVLPTKLPKKALQEESLPAENLGKPRGDETPEQKKERKKQQKELKKAAREEKKAYKVAFKHEELRQGSIIKSGSLAKRVVVKY